MHTQVDNEDSSFLFHPLAARRQPSKPLFPFFRPIYQRILYSRLECSSVYGWSAIISMYQIPRRNKKKTLAKQPATEPTRRVFLFIYYWPAETEIRLRKRRTDAGSARSRPIRRKVGNSSADDSVGRRSRWAHRPPSSRSPTPVPSTPRSTGLLSCPLRTSTSLKHRGPYFVFLFQSISGQFLASTLLPSKSVVRSDFECHLATPLLSKIRL